MDHSDNDDDTELFYDAEDHQTIDRTVVLPEDLAARDIAFGDSPTEPLSDRLNSYLRPSDLPAADTGECADDDDDDDRSEEELAEMKQTAEQYKEEGNDHFRDGYFKEALEKYAKAVNSCPKRAKLLRSKIHSNRAACYSNIGGSRKEAIEECSKAIKLDDKFVKPLLRRAKLYEEDEKLDESLADYVNVLKLDAGCREAREVMRYLPQKVKDEREKLKTEMMGKLKELGNTILKPFGLSTENFQVVQDEKTGGYSINMNK